MDNKIIIAEIGQNHCGDMSLAKYLIKEAKDNGADLAKFQLYDHASLYGDKLVASYYQDVSLSFKQAKDLFKYGEEVGIEVFFSVFDVEKVEWCEKIGVKRYKIACTMRDGFVLKAVASTNKSVIMSMEDIYDGGYYCASTKARLDYLNCVSKYPAEITDYDFETIDWTYDYEGISDHTIGLDCAKIAFARGSSIVEKHFCLDHQTGIDAEWSMDSNELKELSRWRDVCDKVLNG